MLRAADWTSAAFCDMRWIVRIDEHRNKASVWTISHRSPNFFGINTEVAVDSGRDVATPPIEGLQPDLIVTGSSLVLNRIGIVALAVFAAKAPTSPPPARITRAPPPNKLAADAGKRSYSPRAQRYSIVTFPFRRRTRHHSGHVETPSIMCPKGSGDEGSINPTTGIGPCCAAAATGHAATPPSSVINSRRFTCSPP